MVGYYLQPGMEAERTGCDRVVVALVAVAEAAVAEDGVALSAASGD